MARFITNAEYLVVATAVAATNWVMNLLQEQRIPVAAAPTVYCDTVGTTYLSESRVSQSHES